MRTSLLVSEVLKVWERGRGGEKTIIEIDRTHHTEKSVQATDDLCQRTLKMDQSIIDWRNATNEICLLNQVLRFLVRQARIIGKPIPQTFDVPFPRTLVTEDLPIPLYQNFYSTNESSVSNSVAPDPMRSRISARTVRCQRRIDFRDEL